MKHIRYISAPATAQVARTGLVLDLVIALLNAITRQK
jgi:hypothetical protein